MFDRRQRVMDEFTFFLMRPVWLWGLLPLLALLAGWWRQKQGASAWQTIVDPVLQPYVIEPGESVRGFGMIALFAGWLLTIFALSGPVWERQQVSVYEALDAEVLLLDLSRSMLTNDIKPDRLTRARYKVSDWLARATGTQIALVGFSERPYVISPLTDDTATVRAFLPSLSPDIMPVQGSRIDLAIAQGVQLLQQAEITSGQLLLITDGEVSAADISAARAVADAGHHLSIIGVGTERGAPLKGVDGRFMRTAEGAVVVPQLNMQGLKSLAKAGGGIAVVLSSDSADLDSLAGARTGLAMSGDKQDAEIQRDWWVERSPWLVFVIAAGALLLFRRGVAA